VAAGELASRRPGPTCWCWCGDLRCLSSIAGSAAHEPPMPRGGGLRLSFRRRERSVRPGLAAWARARSSTACAGVRLRGLAGPRGRLVVLNPPCCCGLGRVWRILAGLGRRVRPWSVFLFLFLLPSYSSTKGFSIFSQLCHSVGRSCSWVLGDSIWAGSPGRHSDDVGRRVCARRGL